MFPPGRGTGLRARDGVARGGVEMAAIVGGGDGGHGLRAALRGQVVLKQLPAEIGQDGRPVRPEDVDAVEHAPCVVSRVAGDADGHMQHRRIRRGGVIERPDVGRHIDIPGPRRSLDALQRGDGGHLGVG